MPGDKSISHRALILGALTVGQTSVSGLLEGEDVLHTAQAMRALGASLERGGDGIWRIHGVGVGGFARPAGPLDFGNSGTGCRLALGAVAGSPVTATFIGDASLSGRPMRRVLDPLEKMGARVLDAAEGGRLPLTLQGAADPLPIVYESPVPSAQLKSAVLLAGLAAPGETTVIEAEATRDHTELLLRHFGAKVTSKPHGEHGRRITLIGQPELAPANVAVPADPSSAAFPLVAALLVPGSELILEAVMTNPLRTGLYATLKEMGAAIETLATRDDGGEEVADLRVRASTLKRRRCAGAARAVDDRRISHSRRGRRLCRRRHRACAASRNCASRRCDRLAATGRHAARQRRRGEIEGDDLIVQGTGPSAGGGMSHRTWITASPWRRWCSGWPASGGADRRRRLHRHQLSGLCRLDARARRGSRMIIAIDGPAASGKGTLGRRLAAHYGLRHLDTGLLYRAVAQGGARRRPPARRCGRGGRGRQRARSGAIRRSGAEKPGGGRGRLHRLRRFPECAPRCSLCSAPLPPRRRAPCSTAAISAPSSAPTPT